MPNLNLNSSGGQSGAGAFGPRPSGIGETATGLDALLGQPRFTFNGANARGLANTRSLDGETDPPPIVVIGQRNIAHLDVAPTYVRVVSGDLRNDPLDLPDYANEIVVEGKRPKVEVVTDCPKMADATEKALDELYKNSPTARGLIDQMAAKGTTIDASDVDNTGFGKQAGYKDGVIVWDAFQGLTGSNGQGGSFIHAPILVLAHEIVHAALGTTGLAAEQKATELADQIASELKAATGSDYGTPRNIYGLGQTINVNSAFSTIISITPVGCK